MAVSEDRARDLLDEDGRPLGEWASPRYSSDMTQLATCPYSGARRGGSMNVSALAQIMSNWPAVLAALRSEGTVLSAWRVTVAALVAPLRFAETAQGRPIPRQLSAVYKTCLGFNQVLLHVLLSGDVATRPLSELGDAQAFLGLLESGRFLVGAQQVCSGPPHRIQQAFDALAERGNPVPDATVDAVCTHMLALVRRAIITRPTSGPAWIRPAILVPREPGDVDRVAQHLS